MAHRIYSTLGLLPFLLSACGGGEQAANATPAPEVPIVAKANILYSALNSPWGMAFLPDGRILISQKAGTMVVLAASGKTLDATVTGLPAVQAAGQGGLLGIALDPDFTSNQTVYFCYSEPGVGAESGKAGTSVAQARLNQNRLDNLAVIFRQQPKVTGSGHFGCRLVFAADKTLFVSLGERQLGSPAQDLLTHLGKIVRINRDGSAPADNPKFVTPALAGIWSLGHRNPQGLAIHPNTGQVWISEHGPQGGDEINVAQAGKNYGWPIKSYGCNYGDPVGDACRIGGGVHAPEFVEPISYWVPTSIAPSNILFYTGSQFPAWRGNLFVGALAGLALWRVSLQGTQETARERLFAELNERIRDVQQGPDGWIYLLTDSGKLIQISK